MVRAVLTPGRLHTWDVQNSAYHVERTFLECIISDSANACMDIIIKDDEPASLGMCRSNAMISRGRTLQLWEQTHADSTSF